MSNTLMSKDDVAKNENLTNSAINFSTLTVVFFN